MGREVLKLAFLERDAGGELQPGNDLRKGQTVDRDRHPVLEIVEAEALPGARVGHLDEPLSVRLEGHGLEVAAKAGSVERHGPILTARAAYRKQVAQEGLAEPRVAREWQGGCGANPPRVPNQLTGSVKAAK